MMVAMVNQMHLSNTKSWYKGLSYRQSNHVPESCQTHAVHVIGKGRCSCRLQSQGTPPFFDQPLPHKREGLIIALVLLHASKNDQDEGYR